MQLSQGYIFKHGKEICLVARSLSWDRDKFLKGQGVDVIFEARAGNSMKPTGLYELIEGIIPNGKFVELFGRKNNLRNTWTTIGLEF